MSHKISNYAGRVWADGFFTICDSKGDSFSVKTAGGVRAEMLVVFDTSGTTFHSGIVFDNNSFIIKDSDGLEEESSAVMVHRLHDCVEVFPGTKAALISRLKSCLRASEKIAQFELGEKVIVAEEYADALNKEINATFKIQLKDFRTETNCLRFCQRVVSIGFDDIPPGALEKAFKENGVNKETAHHIDNIWHSGETATAGDYEQQLRVPQTRRRIGVCRSKQGQIQESLRRVNANIDVMRTSEMQERCSRTLTRTDSESEASNEVMGTAWPPAAFTSARAVRQSKGCIIM